MIEVLYTKYPAKLPNKLRTTYLDCLPEDLRDINQKYRRWEDQHAHLLGKLLLVLGLRQYGFDKEILTQLSYTAQNRPYIPNSIDFNISHSGYYVLCAIGRDIQIGVDIEEIKPIDFNDFTMVMTNQQWEEIKKANDPMRKFYNYWTIKESIIKADSRGLSIPLEELDWSGDKAVYEDNEWNIQPLSIDNCYSSHLATNIAEERVVYKQIDFYDEKNLDKLS